MEHGWIKLHRIFTDWEWYHDSRMVHLFLHLIISANNRDGEWRGLAVKKGQLITGRKEICNKTGMSEQSIRTCLSRLKSTNEITIKSTNKYSIITITKYEQYQSQPQLKAGSDLQSLPLVSTLSEAEGQPQPQPNQQLTSIQPAINQQLTTNKKDKKYKKERNIYIAAIAARKQSFFEHLNTFAHTCPKETITEFFDYWTELNKSQTQMRFEMQKTWETSLRLKTWMKRSQFSNSKPAITTERLSKNKLI